MKSIKNKKRTIWRRIAGLGPFLFDCIQNNPPPVIGVRWGARGDGGRGREGEGRMEVGGWWRRRLAPPMIRPPPCPPLPVPPCPPSLPPARRCSRSSLAGPQPAREGAQKAKKAPFGLQNRFLAPKTILSQKCILARKNRDMGSKTQKMGNGAQNTKEPIV